MGHVWTKIKLSNPRDAEIRPVEVSALADTGSMYLCIPEHVALQLGVETFEEREVIVADGRRRKCPYVGPIHVHFDNRSCFVGALVLGNEVLLGSVPMEDMDLVISPTSGTVTVNPESPNIATGRVLVAA